MILHPRSEWTSRTVPTGTPAQRVSHVFVHHEGGGVRGNPADKPAVLRSIEAYVLGKGYAAIDYNLMVFQDGSVWEGRGLAHEDAATLGWNAGSVSVCAVGNFQTETPTPALLQGIADAIQLARAGGWVTPDCQVLGHRDAGTFSTSCPGDLLEAQLPAVRQILAGGAPLPAPNPPAAPPADLPLEADAMQTIHYPIPGQDALHTFWIDGQGHLRHAWEPTAGGGGGYEDLTANLRPGVKVNETLLANRGLSVYIGPKLELVVRGVAADGACCEWRWPATGTGWGARIIGRV